MKQSKQMKWTKLRLNMLPITAIEVQFACQNLTKLHNALVQSFTQQSNTLYKQKSGSATPLFTSSQNFIPITQNYTQSKQSFNQQKTIKQTIEQTLFQYNRLRQSMQTQIIELKQFYIKHNHDSSANLFHMLRLRLERSLFDCNIEKNNKKKVLTKTQQQTQYLELADKFSSNQVKEEKFITNYSNDNFLESTDTFKQENFIPPESLFPQGSKNEFLDYQDHTYEKLDFDSKASTKKYISEIKIKTDPLQEEKSTSPVQKNNKNQLANKIRAQKANSQTTIATQNSKQKIVNLNEQKLSSHKTLNQQSDLKSTKVLTTNNSFSKSSQKSLFSNKVQASKISTAQKATKMNDKSKTSYTALNQKKQEQKKIQPVQKSDESKFDVKNPSSSALQTHTTSKTPAVLKSKPNLQPNSQITQQPQKDLQNNQIKKLQEIFLSNPNQLRFTIKMSRQQYKSLLQLKNKMALNQPQ